MFFKSARMLVSLMSLALSQRTLGAEHQVVVGGPGALQFSPSSVTAVPGDTVTFVFKQKNHTATQSTFENPCQMSEGGFDSGFFPISDDNVDGPFPAAQYDVIDTSPVWVYCRQGNHCQKGMVFAINPGDKFAAFEAAAMGNSDTQQPASSSATPPASTAIYSTAKPPATTSSSAQSRSASATTSTGAPISTSTSNDHRIVVGGINQLAFNPANITAQVGDTVTFEFRQKNHTVTQSTFAQPCTSLTQTSTSGQVGFDSGFYPVADGASTFLTFTIQINNTAPIWAYCKQGNHCGQGMVFSINAVEFGQNSFAAFQARAEQLNGTALGNNSSNSGALKFRNRFGATILGALAVIAFLL